MNTTAPIVADPAKESLPGTLMTQPTLDLITAFGAKRGLRPVEAFGLMVDIMAKMVRRTNEGYAYVTHAERLSEDYPLHASANPYGELRDWDIAPRFVQFDAAWQQERRSGRSGRQYIDLDVASPAAAMQQNSLDAALHAIEGAPRMDDLRVVSFMVQYLHGLDDEINRPDSLGKNCSGRVLACHRRYESAQNIRHIIHGLNG